MFRQQEGKKSHRNTAFWIEVQATQQKQFPHLSQSKFDPSPFPFTQQEAVKVSEAGAGKWDQINLLVQIITRLQWAF